jgi:hypothetical protein
MIFRSRNFQLGLMLATALAVSLWPAAGQAYTPEQEQACTSDAFRLCSAQIPNVDAVTQCMVAKKSQLSPDCRSQFRPEPEVTPVSATRPLSIKPASARKRVGVKPVSVKPRKKKPKKPAAT